MDAADSTYPPGAGLPALLAHADVQQVLQLSYRSVKRLVEAGELAVVLVRPRTPGFTLMTWPPTSRG